MEEIRAPGERVSRRGTYRFIDGGSLYISLRPSTPFSRGVRAEIRPGKLGICLRGAVPDICQKEECVRISDACMEQRRRREDNRLPEHVWRQQRRVLRKKQVGSAVTDDAARLESQVIFYKYEYAFNHKYYFYKCADICSDSIFSFQLYHF